MKTNSRIEHNGFRILSAHDDVYTRRLLEDILSSHIDIVRVFKDDRRNYVARFRYGEDDLVVKRPRGRSDSWYERILTLFRDGEAFRRFQSMSELIRLGLHGSKPVLAAERRSYGMVVDNLFVYHYTEGVPAGPGNEKQVLAALLALYNHGYTRRDSKPTNFLLSGNRVHFIDYRLSRPVLFRKLRIGKELNRFFRNMPSALEHYDTTRQHTACFRIARFLDTASFRLSKIKKALRRLVR